MSVPDNYSQWRDNEDQKEKWLESRPVCAYCTHHIQDEQLWVIHDKFYHENCAEEEFKKWTEDYT